MLSMSIGENRADSTNVKEMQNKPLDACASLFFFIFFLLFVSGHVDSPAPGRMWADGPRKHLAHHVSI